MAIKDGLIDHCKKFDTTKKKVRLLRDESKRAKKAEEENSMKDLQALILNK